MNIIDHLIWILINYSLLFDSINGFFLNSGKNILISSSVKTVLILLVVLRLCEKKTIASVIFVFLYVAFLNLHFSLFIPELLGETFNHLFKFLSVILLFLYVKMQMLSFPQLTHGRIQRTFKIALYVLLINILCGMFGMGYAQYSGGIGSRGFFYAGNEVSGVALVLFSYILFRQMKLYGKSSWQYISISFLLLISSILLVTKTAILGTLATIFIIQDGSGRKRKVFKTLIILIIVFVGSYYAVEQTGILSRWQYMYDKGGILSLLLSNRDSYLIEESVDYIQSGVLGWLFGLGGNRSVEMDPFDALFNYGIIGFTIVYTFYFSLLLKAKRLKKKYSSPYSSLALYIDALLLIVSCFSGHILFSGMIGVFVALTNGLMFYPYQLERNFK
ncbi:O-antigen ligase family protein [Bacteroides sp.]